MKRITREEWRQKIRDTALANRKLREISCTICGTMFVPRITRKSNKFCSRKCFHTSTVGKYNGSLDEWREKGGTPWNKGVHVALNNKLIEWRKKNPNLTKEVRLKLREIGLKRVRDGKHNNYKGGITSVNEKIRKSVEMKFWRESVFKRDDYVCQACGQRGGQLQADHELPFALYPDLRFELLNGRTLCKPCHLKTDTWGYRKQNIYA